MKRRNLVVLLAIVLVGIQSVSGQTQKIEGSDVIWTGAPRVCINGTYSPATSNSFIGNSPERCSSNVMAESTGTAAIYALKNNEELKRINTNLNNLATSINANTESFKAMQAEVKKQNEEFNAKIQKSIVNRFDALPTTILSQIRTNQEFRQEVIKLLLTDNLFKAELALIKKEIVEEIKGNIAVIVQPTDTKSNAPLNSTAQESNVAKFANK